MGPVMPMDNARHSSSWHAVHSSEVDKSHAGLRELRAPGDDLLVGVDGRRVIFADHTMPWRAYSALLIVAILNVISVVTKPKMSRIHAEAVSYVSNRIALIAAMTHQHPFGNGSIVEFVRDTMGFGRSAPAISSDIDLSVSVRASARSPMPTVIGAALVNLCPKASSDGLQDSHFVVVSLDKAQRLPFDNTPFGVSISADRGQLSTTAVAKSWFNFVRGFVRGMLCHVSSSFQLFTVPRAISSSAVAFRVQSSIIAHRC